MDANKIREKVQDLIIEGKLQDAAEEIIDFLDSGVMNKKDKALFQLYNQSIHQISQLNELKNAKLSGIIDPDDADRKRNQIRMALLDINSRISNLGASEQEVFEPIEKATGTGDGGSEGNKVLYAIIGVLVAGIIGLSAMFFLKKDDNPPARVKSEVTKVEPEKEKPSREIIDPKTKNTLTTQEDENEKRKREEAARRKKIEEAAKRVAEEEARKKKLAETGSKTTVTKINPELIKTVQINPNIAKALLDDFGRLTYEQIKSNKSKMRMSGIDGNTKLKVGSLLAFRAGTGRYGKLKVLEVGNNLKIKAVIYDTPESVYKSTNSLTIRGDYGCDLDRMVETARSGMDFRWEGANAVKKYFRPRDQAIFYQIK